jgi:hypothetical protein
MQARVPLFDLSTILWHERRLLTQLERGAAARVALQVAELDRAVVVHELAAELDLDQDVTLLDLAAALPAPWPVVLEEHRGALHAATSSPLPRSLADFLR